MNNITAIFLSVILQSFPYIIIGAAASAILEAFIPSDVIKRLSKGNAVRNIVIFASFGFIMPICECGIIPVIKRLRDKGVPVGPLVAYLLAAPAFQPIVFFSTYSAFNNNFKIALIRCLGSFFIAIVIAFFMRNQISEKNNFNEEHNDLQNQESCKTDSGSHHIDDVSRHSKNFKQEHINSHIESCGCGHNHSHSCGINSNDKTARFMAAFFNDFIMILKYLVIGAFFSSVFSFYNPIDIYNNPQFVNAGSIFIMMFMAVALSVCSEADAFVAYSFNYFPLASKMAFMWLGPVLDIKLIILYSSIFNKKFMIKIFSAAIILVAVFSFIYSFFKI
ncbi:MAG TPA: permease [bacterium]|nr:permease [bacterium]HPN30176.1 permease [bacterium]